MRSQFLVANEVEEVGQRPEVALCRTLVLDVIHKPQQVLGGGDGGISAGPIGKIPEAADAPIRSCGGSSFFEQVPAELCLTHTIPRERTSGGAAGGT